MARLHYESLAVLVADSMPREQPVMLNLGCAACGAVNLLVAPASALFIACMGCGYAMPAPFGMHVLAHEARN